ncbi:MAG: hypothetical protein V2A76_13775 [Planctomycetota bacterium]
MRARRTVTCILLAGLLLPGCFTSYRTSGAPVRYGEDCEALLQIGRTSRGEVLQLFGAPTNIQSTQDGEAFRYLYVRQIADGVDIGLSVLFGLISLSLFRTETERRDTDNLTIFFDLEGKLKAYSFSPAFPDNS